MYIYDDKVHCSWHTVFKDHFLKLILYIFLALVLYDEAGRAVTIDEKIFPKIKVQYSYIHLLLLLIYMSNQVIIQH